MIYGTFLCMAVMIMTGCNTDAEVKPGATYDRNGSADEIWELQNLFETQDGNPITDWETRRAEIEAVVSYNQHGNMPPPPTTLSYEVGKITAGAGSAAKEYDGMTITMTYERAGAVRSADLQVIVAVPQNTDAAADGYTSYAPPYPAIIYHTFSIASNHPQLKALLKAGYAVINMETYALQSAVGYQNPNGPYRGVVPELFNYNYFNESENAPSSLLSGAWGAGRVIDALEDGAYAGQIDPTKIAVTGFSQWGKAALVSGAFEKRIGVVNPQHSGAAGAAVERFITPFVPGLEFVKKATAETLDSEPKTYYYTGSGDAFKVAVPGTQGARSMVFGKNNNQVGLQTHDQARGETRAWYNQRFQSFKASYKLGWDVYSGNSGIVVSTPLDQHYLTAMVAPRGLLVNAGFQDWRTNPEGMFFNYLAAREVYKFLNEKDKAAFRLHNLGHDNSSSYLGSDLITFCDYVFRDMALPAGFAGDDAYPYADDPRSYEDYLMLDWAAPGSTSVASEIRAKL